MKINSLLNPFFGEEKQVHIARSPKVALLPLAPRSIPCPRRQKIPKDAPIFSEGNKIHGVINYPPHEAMDDPILNSEHRRFEVYPLGEIATKGVRHIPYNSDKKDFLDKTGREAFEMYQYTYKIPGDPKEYTVVWDYNVGLVRMTPFFKSLKYSKTVPAKAIRENPGLKDISYSITGGALLCQGYWMPYQAAKAIAATFCYEIRWALTPVFGKDFPSLCATPDDVLFAKFTINPAIVDFCTHETNRFRDQGAAYRISFPHITPVLENPQMQFGYPQWRSTARGHRRTPTLDAESGYAADKASDKPFFSPQISPRSAWRPETRSQASSSSPRTMTSSAMSSPVAIMPAPLILLPPHVAPTFDDPAFRAKRTHSKVSIHEPMEVEMARPHTIETASAQWTTQENCRRGAHSKSEIDAAQIMLSLSSVDRLLSPPTKRTRRGSTF